jgi:hypothetical protein
MKTSRILRLARSFFLAVILTGAMTTFSASAAHAQDIHRSASIVSAPPSTWVLPAAWYDHVLNSRSRTIQIVFVLVLIGAFMLRRAS